MIPVFIQNSLGFLSAFADWIVTPVPLSFVGLSLLLFVVRLLKCRFL